jgi:hypothetical protein
LDQSKKMCGANEVELLCQMLGFGDAEDFWEHSVQTLLYDILELVMRKYANTYEAPIFQLLYPVSPLVRRLLHLSDKSGCFRILQVALDLRQMSLLLLCKNISGGI